MKIAICSDVHLEFGFLDLRNTQNADVLVLAGDILLAEDLHKHSPESCEANQSNLGARQIAAIRYRKFINQISKEFPNTVVVAGNHEFYGGRWNDSIQHLRDEYSKHSNVHFLEREHVKIGDVNFVGGTLWTDLNDGDPVTQHVIANMMNDYEQIRHDGLGYRKLRPGDTFNRHIQTTLYIEKTIADMREEKVVIVGHHSPSFMSVSEKYNNQPIMNGAYCSDLSELILDNPQIKLWVHGHTHNNFDYMIGDTRIFCNPRGYTGYELSAEKFQLKFVEV